MNFDLSNLPKGYEAVTDSLHMAKDSDTGRNWATVFYLDSAPSDWEKIIRSWHVPAFVSPYHGSDLRADKTPKKGHYHLMVMFDGNKRASQIKELFNEINGVGILRLKSLSGYARYLCHFDDPDKHRYDELDVKCFSGADYTYSIGCDFDKERIFRELEDFCETADITNYYLLSRYASVHRPDWSRALHNFASVHMREYLRFRRFSKQDRKTKIVNRFTGELLLDVNEQVYATQEYIDMFQIIELPV